MKIKKVLKNLKCLKKLKKAKKSTMTLKLKKFLLIYQTDLSQNQNSKKLLPFS